MDRTKEWQSAIDSIVKKRQEEERKQVEEIRRKLDRKQEHFKRFVAFLESEDWKIGKNLLRNAHGYILLPDSFKISMYGELVTVCGEPTSPEDFFGRFIAYFPNKDIVEFICEELNKIARKAQ